MADPLPNQDGGGTGFFGGVGDWLRSADTGFFNALGNATQGTPDVQSQTLEDQYLKALGLPPTDRAAAQRDAGRRSLMDLAVGIGQYAGYRAVPVTFGEVMSGALQHTLTSADQRQTQNNQAIARRIQLGTALTSLQKQRQGQAMFGAIVGMLQGGGAGQGVLGPTGATGGPAVTTAPMAAPGDLTAVIDRTYDPLVTHESGGDPNARSKTSSAFGPAQFIDGTWLTYYKRLHPDTGETDADILAKRTDPTLNRELYKAYATDNGAKLASAGHPVTESTIALSHFLDGSTAAKVLSAPPNTPLEQVIGTAAWNANKAMFDKQGITTTGGLTAYYNTRFPAAGGTTATAGAPGAPAAPGTAAAPFQGIDLSAPEILLAMSVGASDPAKGAEMLMQAIQAQRSRQATNAPRVMLTAAEVKARPELNPNQAYQRNTLTGQIEPIGGAQENPQQQALNREDTWRGEFMKLPEVQKYMQGASSYTAMRRVLGRGMGGNDPIADIDLVYAAANLFDPGSVVREGESIQIIRSGGFPSMLNSALATVTGGGKFTDVQRQQIMRAGQGRIDSYWDAVQPHADAYRDLARGAPGASPDRVVLLRPPSRLAEEGDKTPGATIPAASTSAPGPVKPDEPAKPPPSLVPPADWNRNAAIDRYAAMSAADFAKVNLDTIPPYERAIAATEARKRQAAAANKPR